MAKQFFQKVGSTRIIPISFKILTIFVSLLLLSNFATNFVNLHLSRKQLIDLNNEVMVSQLKDIFTAAGNQYQIYTFTGDMDASVQAIESTARRSFDQPYSSALAFSKDGKILFCATNSVPLELKHLLEKEEKTEEIQNKINSFLADDLTLFTDSEALETMNQHLEAGQSDGSIKFQTGLGQYFGVYKYQEEWQCYFVRAELRADTMKSNVILLGIVSIIIFVMVVGFLVAGLFMFKKILSSVNKITGSLYEMQSNQKLSTIDLSESPNDDVTYLAASFNSLSSTINNLLGIFQKFASKDVVAKAYNDHEIRLEGSQKNLVMLFSDIKSFTFRTETLGNDIIDLLNVHYDKVIHTVHQEKGVIGSIIGDAILAIYGTQETQNKSLDSLEAAWKITRVTANLREKMIERRKEIEKSRSLTESEERIYEAVLIDIGVGIDGGKVFYGNIGSDEHMTNTVIGDNVNSASRLEGLTRIYHLPVIVSSYIKKEIEAAGITKYKFYEIDTVQVKGKTEGKKIYFPMDDEFLRKNGEMDFETYSRALQAYYNGDWNEARKSFKNCGISAAEVFLERMGNKSAPENWSGIWTMQTK